MLYIEAIPLQVFEARDDVLVMPGVFFDGMYESFMLESDFSKKVISEIDKVPINGTVFESLLRQGMRPEDLCTGTKNLIVCKYFNIPSRLTMMGSNCYPYLQEIAVEKDVKMMATNVGNFSALKVLDPPVCIVNYNKFYDNGRDLTLGLDLAMCEVNIAYDNGTYKV